MSAFECDSQLLANLAGSPTFVLFVVETSFCFVFSGVWSLLLAVFAFVFYPAFGRLASSVPFAVVIALASASVDFLRFLALLLFASAGVLVH